MSARRLGGNEHASVINRLFHTVRGRFAVVGNIRPDTENIRFGKRREGIRDHLLDKRQSSFIA